MSERIGIAVIGCGMAAAPHARALRDLAHRAEVIGVHARKPATRQAFCSAWGFPEAEDGHALLNRPSVDMVLLLTPPDARVEWVGAAAERGLPVLMEKPVERTLTAASGLVQLCETAGTPFGIVFQHRFRAAALALRERVQQAAWGPLHLVKVDVPWWREQRYYDEPGRGSYARDGGGVLISQAIHTLDLMLSLTGPVADVRALTATTGYHRMESEDLAVSALRFENGALGSLTATTAQYPGGAESLELGFARATARLCAGELTVRHLDGRVETLGDTQETGAGADPMAFPHDWHLALLSDFVDSIAAGRPPAVTARDALQVHRLIDAIVQSSAAGRAVNVSHSDV
ncbi:MAG: Gfo/Idh/MocA family oxidoreductase [Pseudomonadota bacterium]